MKRKILVIVCCVALVGKIFAQVQINPPFSMPDVNIIQVGDRAYAFCGTDLDPHNMEIQKFVMPYWRCFSSSDLIHWEFESMLHPENTYIGETDKCFAGHGVEKDGKWYWYFSDFVKTTGVATSDSPKGPWKDALGKPMLPEELTDAHEYDNCVFFDDDGQAYMTFGNHNKRKLNYHIAKLSDDLLSLAEEPRKFEIIGDYSKDTPPVDASFLHKHGDYYYLSWRSPYAISKNIYGPYTYMGEHDARGHLGFFDFNNQNFVNYTSLKEDTRRRYRFASIAYVNYKQDGSIAHIDPIIMENGVGQYDANWKSIQCEWYMAKPNGPEKFEIEGDNFGVKNLQNGNYLNFPNINKTPYDAVIELTYSCEKEYDGEVVVKAYKPNGPELGRTKIKSTGSWDKFEAMVIPLNKNPEGSVSISMVFEGKKGKELLRVDSFRIIKL